MRGCFGAVWDKLGIFAMPTFQLEKFLKNNLRGFWFLVRLFKGRSHSTSLDNHSAKTLCTCSVGGLISKLVSFALIAFTLIDNGETMDGSFLKVLSYYSVIAASETGWSVHGCIFLIIRWWMLSLLCSMVERWKVTAVMCNSPWNVRDRAISMVL